MYLHFLAALISVSLIFLFVFLKHKRLRNSIHPPGPPRLPFIGNLHQFDVVNPHIYLQKLSKKYGPLILMKLGKVPVLVVSSAELAKEVLKTQDNAFCSRPRILGQFKLSYNGMDVAFTPYSTRWRELRKIYILHLLSNKKVQSFRPVREEEVSRLIENISVMASSGQAANVSKLTLFYTSSLTCRIAFAKIYDAEGSERLRFDELLRETQAMLAAFFVSDFLPLFGWVDKLSGMISRLDNICQKLDEFFEELIDEHLDPNSPKSLNPNILDLLIQLKEDKSCSIKLTRDHIKAALMDILVAASDTSAATITWTMTALIKNPNTMKKLQKEIREHVGNKGKVNEDDLPKLSYLQAVIKESMRLYPPVPLLVARETIQECVLESYTIPPKTTVYINSWAIARDPQNWINPKEFVPERFLNSNIDIIGQDFQVFPFGAGRRGCPGISLGLVTVEIALANLLYTFDWELPSGIKKEDIDEEVSPGITMHKKNALCLMPKTYLCA